MRYRVVVSRVQVAERFVRAPDEEGAIKKVQDELNQPYGFFAAWKTTNTDIEVAEATSSVPGTPGPIGPDGPLLLSINDAAKQLGVSRGTLYEMMSTGELPHISIGRRRLISREALKAFIEAHSRVGRGSD